jgi:hypothetical protein
MEMPIGDFSILQKCDPRRCLPRNSGRHRKYGANSLGFANECLGDVLPWVGSGCSMISNEIPHYLNKQK